jgi:hypothetical protein
MGVVWTVRKPEEWGFMTECKSAIPVSDQVQILGTGKFGDIVFIIKKQDIL